MAAQFHEQADFSIEGGGTAAIELNFRLVEEWLNGESGGVVWFARGEENFKLRMRLLDLGREGFGGVGIESAQGFEDRDWLGPRGSFAAGELAQRREDGEALIEKGGKKQQPEGAQG